MPTELQAMPFGELLQELREKAGLSQAALSERTGLSVRSIQNWEQGHRGPSASAVLVLAKAFGIPAEKLLAELTGGKKTAKGRRGRGRPRKPR